MLSLSKVLLPVGVALAVVGFAVAGCGGEDGVEQLEGAVEELGQARSDVESAREKLAEKRKAVDEAEAAVAQARQALSEAEQRLATAESSVDLKATDDVLFRTIQKRLLEDEALEDVAISARVDKGVVVLSGRVPDAALRDRALEIAGSVPGSVAVQSQIDVSGGAGEPDG